MDANEICGMTAVETAARVRAGELSPLEVVDAVLARMDALEPELHAFCTPTPELARRDARRVEQALQRGERTGPLAGVPVSVKDLIFTKGIRTVSGCAAYRDFVPDEDDVAVERLKAAGAILLGKTNVTELGYSAASHNPVFETTRNPWDVSRTSGGSSAGAGAAVASGVGALALGSDGGGSVRIPAAFCGTFGIKPSMGRIPLYPGARDERYPGASGWESLECYGPLTRTVRDAALMLSVVTGPDMRDRHSLPRADFDWLASCDGELRGARVAYSPDWGYMAVEPEVADLVARAVRVFERDLGCVVEEASPGWPDPAAAFAAVMIGETDLRGMRAMVAEHGGEMSSHLVDLLSRPWTAEDLTDANMVRKSVVNAMWRLMTRYDLLLTPTAPVAAFPLHMQGPERIGGRYVRPESFLGFTFPLNFTGQPAASVPCGFTRDGLPVGLQIVGRHLDDATVLRASAAFEAAQPWAHRWPPVATTSATKPRRR